MRRLRLACALLVVLTFGYCVHTVPHTGPVVLEAQTLPYTLTVAWNASPNAVTYTCYLDGAEVKNGVSATTCTFPVATLGPHTVGVSAVNPTFVPPESAQATLSFTLRMPASPTGVTVR